ncbi:hypothetical protein IE81DRAFT_324724 [Ceraceosorus guamensis]|uniref:Uncharacterized protein n=1 Tax=Ceraceosorus guamensis TaxID=1522189 RepID=A0A316VWA5_9BASI|nr:hypothetical protein IE81DRAFT_324724 [Ceraceosorus guamensis]PWN41228.1 hypothetical protein IE81DRAFT_324724 [Ceraceosorus guamensis]
MYRTVRCCASDAVCSCSRLWAREKPAAHLVSQIEVITLSRFTVDAIASWTVFFWAGTSIAVASVETHISSPLDSRLQTTHSLKLGSNPS